MGAGWIIAACVALIAICVAVRIWRYRGSSTWPTTDGVIEGEPEIHVWDDGASRYATVFYSYSVAGERYSGEWNSPTVSSESKLRESLAASLPKGSSVIVRYRPDKPDLSTLEVDTAALRGEGMIKLGL